LTLSSPFWVLQSEQGRAERTEPPGGVMLDAYIIERIRREREEQERQQTQVPLYIEPPPPPRHEPVDDDSTEERDRGSTVIDFHL